MKYFRDLISGWKGTDGVLDITIVSAFRIGIFKSGQRYPKNIIIKLPSWEIKVAILAAYRRQSTVSVEGNAITILSDLSILNC